MSDGDDQINRSTIRYEVTRPDGAVLHYGADRRAAERAMVRLSVRCPKAGPYELFEVTTVREVMP